MDENGVNRFSIIKYLMLAVDFAQIFIVLTRERYCKVKTSYYFLMSAILLCKLAGLSCDWKV